MSDAYAAYLPAIALSTHDNVILCGANRFELVDGMPIYSVLAFRGRQHSVAEALAAFPASLVRNAGPGEWLVVGENIDIRDAMTVDQSHGKALFRLTGPNGMATLMRGVGIDLAGGALPIGGSTNVGLGHLSINLAHIAEDAFELIVGRSFAESLWHDMTLACRSAAHDRQ